MQNKKQQIEPDKEKWTGSILGKEYIKTIYCDPAYLTYMHSTSWEMQPGWSTSRNQGCQKKYQQPQICKLYHFNGRKWRVTKESLDEGERGESKSRLKT